MAGGFFCYNPCMRFSRQFIKYTLVGATGTILDIGTLFILVEYAGFPILPAATVSFLLGGINNFLLHKFWTFKNRSKKYVQLYLKFLIISLIGLGINLSLIHLLANIFAIWYMLAKVLTAILVLVWNYFGNKFWTFLDRGLIPWENSTNFDLTVIIPAFNEEDRIGKTLESIHHFFKEKHLFSIEIIVVNDGSTDNTEKILENYLKKFPELKIHSSPKNCGKGFAVKEGIKLSQGNYILMTDADNSTPIEEFDRLYKKLKEEDAEIAIGSRYIKGSNVKISQPLSRRLLGRIGNLLIQTLLLKDIQDTQCGFKLFKASAAHKIFSRQKVERFGFDMEILTIAKKLGHKIVEVPVSWTNSAEHSRLRPIKDSLITLKDLLLIRLKLWLGYYN